MESGIRHNAYLNYEPDTLPYDDGPLFYAYLAVPTYSIIVRKRRIAKWFLYLNLLTS